MKAAGLNPILAAGQGGASTPSGSMAQQEGFADAGNNAISAISSASQIKNVNQNTQKLEAETRGANANAYIAEAAMAEADNQRTFHQSSYGLASKYTSGDSIQDAKTLALAEIIDRKYQSHLPGNPQRNTQSGAMKILPKITPDKPKHAYPDWKAGSKKNRKSPKPKYRGSRGNYPRK